MEEIRFISNTGSSTEKHYHYIEKEIKDVIRVVLCVSYWKDNISEQNNIIDRLLSPIASNKNISLEIYISLNEFITEPDALLKLYNMKINCGAHICLRACTKLKYFHSKLYYFLREDRFSIMTGSANFTAGGLLNNDEVSLYFSSSKDHILHTDVKRYISGLTKRSEDVDLDLINTYRTNYDKQHKKRNKIVKKESK